MTIPAAPFTSTNVRDIGAAEACSCSLSSATSLTYLSCRRLFLALSTTSPARPLLTVTVIPLSQLNALDPDESTNEAIGDWRYWVSQG